MHFFYQKQGNQLECDTSAPQAHHPAVRFGPHGSVRFSLNFSSVILEPRAAGHKELVETDLIEKGKFWLLHAAHHDT